MIHLRSLLHTSTLFQNRWGGPDYRTTELAKFMNKNLFDKQEKDLAEKKSINTTIINEALLGADHTPRYMNSLRCIGLKTFYEITDSLGYKAKFAEGTEILTYIDAIEWRPIEYIRSGHWRIINFELVPDLKNDKLQHHTKFTEQFQTIKCKSPEETQIVLCDSLTSMAISKEIEENVVGKIEQFSNKNTQELYIVEIAEVLKIETPMIAFEFDLQPFSYSLSKDRKNSSKANNRYLKAHHRKSAKKYLEKMRNKVFNIKKSHVEFEMELKREETY